MDVLPALRRFATLEDLLTNVYPEVNLPPPASARARPGE
jgi:hypothetical protein